MKHGKGSKTTSSTAKSPGKGAGKGKKQGSSAKESRSKVAAPGGSARASQGRSGGTGFSNPLVANAFKRALKKYSAALKRLTD